MSCYPNNAKRKNMSEAQHIFAEKKLFIQYVVRRDDIVSGLNARGKPLREKDLVVRKIL